MKKYLYLTLAIMVVVVIALIYVSQTTDIKVNHSETSTEPAKIERVKQIGEWAFLSIADEEIIDTVAEVKRIWPLRPGKKQLTRIYSGVLRLGFDLQKDTREGWIEAHGDTVKVSLPPVRLLDERFVDEASARAVIEEGDWSAQDRSRLYDMAVRKMKRVCLSAENMERARTTARDQMERLLRELGFKEITVEFDSI